MKKVESDGINQIGMDSVPKRILTKAKIVL